jgi:YidC/Oxa1 family membrane protein insertase
MDRRTLTAILVALTVWTVYLAVFPPPEKPPEPTPAEAPAATPAPATPTPGSGPAPIAAAPARDVPIDLCRTHAVVTTATGGLRSWTLADQPHPIRTQVLYSWILSGFSGPWQPYSESPEPREVLGPLADGLMAGAGPLGAAPPVEVVEEGPGRLVTRAVTPDGLEIVRTLTSDGTPCRAHATVTWRNGSAAPYGAGVWVAMQDVLHESTSRYAAAARPHVLIDGSGETLSKLDPIPTPTLIEGTAGWFGIDDHFFGAYAVPTDAGAAGRAAFTSRPVGEALAHGVHYVLPGTIPPGGSVSADFALYGGPKVVEELEAIDPSLGAAVELGWFSALARPLLWLLKLIHGAVDDWGLAIIGLTLLVKLVLFPLTQKSFKSTQEMAAIQPEMNRIREQYKDNPEELNRKTMELWREHGVNPFGGCLPMLVQMPVFFALFSTLQSSVELNGASFLYLRDLGAPDPYMVLPTVVMGLMLLQQQMMPTANMDPAQARMMKVMPILFGVFFYSFPAGLALYTFVNMVLSILQQWYIRRTFRPGPPAAA